MPLRAGKGSVYEGGIREPMLVKWPGVVKPGSVSSQYLIIEDFFPTILEMAGVKQYAAPQRVDGISFMPLLKGTAKADNERALVWHFPNKWIAADDHGVNYRSAMRQGKWKLVFNQKTGDMELYDLKSDIREQQNLTAKYPDVVRRLSKTLGQKLAEYDAQMPVVQSTQQPVTLPY